MNQNHCLIFMSFQEFVAEDKIDQSEIITATPTTNTPNTRQRAKHRKQDNGVNNHIIQNGSAKSSLKKNGFRSNGVVSCNGQPDMKKNGNVKEVAEKIKASVLYSSLSLLIMK
jgi:hypothetical protein